jgi:hypothetical protein
MLKPHPTHAQTAIATPIAPCHHTPLANSTAPGAWQPPRCTQGQRPTERLTTMTLAEFIQMLQQLPPETKVEGAAYYLHDPHDPQVGPQPNQTVAWVEITAPGLHDQLVRVVGHEAQGDFRPVTGEWETV